MIDYLFERNDLPRAINVQLLKCFDRDRRTSMMIVKTFPHMPIIDTRNMYGIDIRMRI